MSKDKKKLSNKTKGKEPLDINGNPIEPQSVLMINREVVASLFFKRTGIKYQNWI